MIFENIIRCEITSITLLNPAIIKAWSRKPVWYWREAIKLSIGCCPNITADEKELSGEEALAWGTGLRNRGDESERAMITGELPYIKIPHLLEDLKTFPAFRPLEFVSWLHQNNLLHPHELYEAVISFHSRELSGPQQSQHLFRKKLQAWEVRFGGIDLDGVKDILGMTYIQLLLQYAGETLDVIEMQGLAGGQGSAGSHDEDDSDAGTEEVSTQYDDNLSVYVETSDRVIDDTARRQYKETIDALKDRLEIAIDTRNTADEAAIRQQIEFIQSELNGATGLGGRTRQLNPLREKYRKSTSKAVKDAIANIRMLEGTTAPIADHLTLCIKLGTTCYYDTTRNNPPIEWHF